MEEDIGHILDLIDYHGGHLITDKTMSYLMDRLDSGYSYIYTHKMTIVNTNHRCYALNLFLLQGTF